MRMHLDRHDAGRWMFRYTIAGICSTYLREAGVLQLSLQQVSGWVENLSNRFLKST